MLIQNNKNRNESGILLDKQSKTTTVNELIVNAKSSMDHNILLNKLSLYGCRDTTLNWFKSYLTCRIQMCKINQAISNQHTIRCGVPHIG